MPRLTTLPPRVAAQPPLLKKQTDAEGHSTAVEPGRAWYSTARWKRLRDRVLLRDHYTCQCGCRHIEPNTAMLVADHKKPHRGDPALFWDETNLQTLWKPHHDADKQRADRRAR